MLDALAIACALAPLAFFWCCCPSGVECETCPNGAPEEVQLVCSGYAGCGSGPCGDNSELNGTFVLEHDPRQEYPCRWIAPARDARPECSQDEVYWVALLHFNNIFGGISDGIPRWTVVRADKADLDNPLVTITPLDDPLSTILFEPVPDEEDCSTFSFSETETIFSGCTITQTLTPL